MSVDKSQFPISDSERLCLSCGLCCSGGLFRKVPVENDEDTKRMIDRGLQLQERADKKRFFLSLPCKALDAGRCACYDCRPAVCCSYRCRLLKRLEGGKCTFEEAQSLVEHSKDLLSRLTRQIRTEFPELAELPVLAACKSIIKRFAALEGPERILFGQSHQEFFIAHAAYSYHVHEHFYRKNIDDEGGFEAEPDPTTSEAESSAGPPQRT